MIVFPNCKINLGLHILRKRNDSYHDLESVFYPIAIKDALEVIKRPIAGFTQTGLNIESHSGENICLKAYQLLKKDFPQLTTAEMHLHKAIPIGAGLGGGSADGAFTLKLLNKIFNLGLTTEKLLDYALNLGSDCPFFIINKPCFATGRGEFLEPVDLNLSAYKIVVINPGIHISTSWAFANLIVSDTSKVADTLKETIQQPVETWKNKLKNDFEEPVFRKYPEIKIIKERLYDYGSVYASISGSGSTVYGIFKKEMTVKNSFPKHYFFKELFC